MPVAIIVRPWTQHEAITLCIQLEAIAPPFGCHIGLTGGTLYKGGERKDCDILIYRIRQMSIDFAGLWAAFSAAGITINHDFGFCVKAQMGDRRIDFLIPESPDSTSGDYQGRPRNANL